MPLFDSGKHFDSPLRRRPSVAEEVHDELDFHVEMVTRELMAGGMSREAALAEARRRFGDRERVDDACRRLGTQRDRSRARAEYVAELGQDVRFACRQLLRARGFAAIAALTLGIGIGVTTAVFSVVNAVVLRPLPFPDQDRIVSLSTSRAGDTRIVAGAELAEWSTRTEVFEQIAGAILQSGFTLTDGDLPEVRGGGRVTWRYFRVFGMPPALGRDFVEADDRPGAADVVVLSDKLWRSRFAADPAILGRQISLDGVAHQVIGIMPPAFDLTEDAEELWVPLRLTTAALTNRTSRFLQAFARLRNGVSIERARQVAIAGERALEERYPDGERGLSVEVGRFADRLVGAHRSRLLVLLGAVGLVLLIACVNVANLLLARGAARGRELAVRAALGATRERIVRQLLAESLTLALVASVVGVVLALVLVRLLVAYGPDEIPRLSTAGVDGMALLFALGAAVASSVLVGLLPALRTARPVLVPALREGGRGASGARDRVRNVLVAVEVALALVLLGGAGLLIRSALKLNQVNPGFEPAGVLTARLVLPGARYPDSTTITEAYRQILERAAAIPGVRSAALASVTPLSGSSMQSGVIPEGRPRNPNGALFSNLRFVSAGYFSTMGIPLRDGRDLTRDDHGRAPLVAVINETMARRLWPNERAIGKRFDALGSKDARRWLEVVGVVGDLRDEALGGPVVPEFYIPYGQVPGALWAAVQRSMVVVVKTPGDPETLIEPLRRAVAQVNKSLPLADPRTMSGYIAGSLAIARMNTLLLAGLGGIAFLLAAVGVYGVVAHFVMHRTREIGIRIALGATPRQVWRLVIQRGLEPIAFGAVIGVAGAIFAGELLRSQLFGIGTTDPITLVAVVGLLMTTSVVAMYVPARRAMRIDPTVALAAE